MRLLRTLLPQIHTTLKADQLKVSIICLKFHHVYVIGHSRIEFICTQKKKNLTRLLEYKVYIKENGAGELE